ncbi:MAG: TIGR01777 family oxidoreductase, partial [Myxococcales bacterium]|nr:TIGR01777 family oxidoreductase [Polyangiaceae bacterium]MDW8251568.1 TIGR01777 family oxidoreductase [Myxococcales bacterium]
EIEGATAVIHLAGEPVLAGRWSDEHKRRVRNSRIESTRLLVEAMRTAKVKPAAFLCASAVGYYGGREGDEELDEESSPGEDFLARVVRDWEAAADRATALGIRVVKLRIGLVLGENGGLLGKMVPLFRKFVGGPVGSGRQVLPWIHIDDTVGLILFALDRPDIQGPLNVTAPSPVTMEEFCHQLGRALRRPSLLRVPAPLLRLALGEAADPMLSGQKALPRVALRQGYVFRHPTLPSALADLFGSTS